MTNGGPEQARMISNAMTNVTRRKMIQILSEGEKSRDDLKTLVGLNMLDYHLNILVQAGLIHKDGQRVNLTDFGQNFMREKQACPKFEGGLQGIKSVQVVEIRQHLPCIADKTKFRIIARMDPPLGSALRVLEPLFPRGRYSEKIGSLIIQKGTILITISGSGNMTMTMVKDENHARQILEEIREVINSAIAKGVTPAPREKVRVDPMEIRKYLPGTNCKECGEQSCYSFAIRLAAGEVDLEACTPLLDTRYATALEHLRALSAYLK